MIGEKQCKFIDGMSKKVYTVYIFYCKTKIDYVLLNTYYKEVVIKMKRVDEEQDMHFYKKQIN